MYLARATRRRTGGFQPSAGHRAVQVGDLRQALRAFAQPVEVQYDNGLAFYQHDALLTQSLERAVDVHQGQPEMVTDLLLSEGQVESQPAVQSIATQAFVNIEYHDANACASV